VAKFRSTITVLEASARAWPSDDLYYRLALEYHSAGRQEDAERALDSAERATDQVFFTRVFLFQLRIAEIYRRAGRFDMAARWLERAIDSTPNVIEPVSTRCPSAYFHLADLFAAAGNAASAAQARELAERARCDGNAYLEHAIRAYAPTIGHRRQKRDAGT